MFEISGKTFDVRQTIQSLEVNGHIFRFEKNEDHCGWYIRFVETKIPSEKQIMDTITTLEDSTTIPIKIINKHLLSQQPRNRANATNNFNQNHDLLSDYDNYEYESQNENENDNNLRLTNNMFTQGRKIDYTVSTKKRYHAKDDTPEEWYITYYVDKKNNLVSCYGDTYDIKEYLKEKKWKWNPSLKTWSKLGIDSIKELKQLCEEFEIYLTKQN